MNSRSCAGDPLRPRGAATPNLSRGIMKSGGEGVGTRQASLKAWLPPWVLRKPMFGFTSLKQKDKLIRFIAAIDKEIIDYINSPEYKAKMDRAYQQFLQFKSQGGSISSDELWVFLQGCE